jgi:hypothetical protein
VGIKGKEEAKLELMFTLEQAMKTKEVGRDITLLFNLGARWGWWSTARSGRFTPGKIEKQAQNVSRKPTMKRKI